MWMSCREYRARLMEVARESMPDSAQRQALMAHAENCAECGRFLEEQQELSAAERLLRAEELPPADAVGARVMAEFDRARSARGVRAPVWRIGIAAALAACLLPIGIHRRPTVAHIRVTIAPPPATAQASVLPSPVRPAAHVRRRSVGSRPSQAAAEFVPFPYTVPIAPEERASVLRMQIPVTALIAAGFDFRVTDSRAVVQADVLVSQDGRARAIRPLSISTTN